MLRASVVHVVVAALLVAAGVSAAPALASGQQEGSEVRITAQRLESGRVEFALQQRGSDGEWGERLLPSQRFFPTGARVGRWLVSSPLTMRVATGRVEAENEVRVAAQRLESGRVEFALQRRDADGGWGERLLPEIRFFPAGAPVGRWLVSSPLTLIPDRTEVAAFSIESLPRSSDTLIAASNSHTCSVQVDRSVRCWGHAGPRNNLSAAIVDQVVTVSIGNHPTRTTFHTCALSEIGSVSCWGAGKYGQHGHPATDHPYWPVAVPGLDDATALAVGSAHTCVVHRDGSVSCWGNGMWGQLGNEIRETRGSPKKVAGLSDAATIAAGVQVTCAVHTDGTLSCWGNRVTDTPTRFRLREPADSVAVGRKDACAVGSTGRVHCWRLTATPRPAPVLGLWDVLAVSVGDGNACAVHRDGGVSCWGENNSTGQLGDGTTTPREVPQRVGGISDAVAVTVSVQSEDGEAHACAVHRDGSVSCWGSNGFGQLGDGSRDPSSVPVAVRFADPLRGADLPTDRTAFLRLWIDVAVREGEADHPWLRAAWDHIRDQSFAIDSQDEINGKAARVSTRCNETGGVITCVSHLLRVFTLKWSHVVHELAHVFDRTTSLSAGKAWGAVQLYFAVQSAGCSSDKTGTPRAGVELLADTMEHSVVPDAGLARYESGECPHLPNMPTSEASDVLRAGLAGQVPRWYSENITSGRELWAALSSSLNVHVLGNLGGEFGGLCSTDWIRFPFAPDQLPPADSNPFRDGGC